MAQETQYKRLLVAPHGIRNGLIDRINHEIANHEDGKPAIKIKVNSIVDEATSDALYRASRAGVPVDLWVRGTCTIRPVCRVSARTSECAASSAASSSTADSSGSQTTDRLQSASAPRT